MRLARKWYLICRIVARFLRRYFSGSRWTVPLPDRNAVVKGAMQPFLRALIADYSTLRHTNRRLLTSMVVALTAGPLLPSWSGWEQYRAGLQRLRRVGVTHRPSWTQHVGRPIVMEIESNGRKVKVGLTEFWQGYVPRAEQLTARKRAKQVQAQGLIPLLTMRGQ